MGGEDSHTFVTPTARNKCKSKEGDSEEEEDEDDTSEDQGEEDDDDEESVGTKGKKAEICEEEVSDGMTLRLKPALKSLFCSCKCQQIHWPPANEIFPFRTTVCTQPAWRSWRNR